jgi:hypothetical protein
MWRGGDGYGVLPYPAQSSQAKRHEKVGAGGTALDEKEQVNSPHGR